VRTYASTGSAAVRELGHFSEHHPCVLGHRRKQRISVSFGLWFQPFDKSCFRITTAIVEPIRPLGNSLLDQAKDLTLDAIGSDLHVARMSPGEVLFDVGDVIGHVWFPISGVVSLCAITVDGDSVGLAAIGAEGIVGASIILGFRVALCRAVVQIEGRAVRVDAVPFSRTLAADPNLHASVLAYTRALLLQVVQSTACSRFHTAEQRLSRWLLETADLARARTFSVTHELLAQILGMRRPWVTKVIRRLRDRGFIRFRRGELVVLDRKGLEEVACECYSRVRQQLRRNRR
jgi:CRP-like cAMP-binding protein